MDPVFFITLFSAFFFVVLIILLVIRALKNSNEDPEESTERSETGPMRGRVAQQSAAAAGLRLRARVNRNTQQQQQQQQSRDVSDNEMNELDDEDMDMDVPGFPKGKIGVKKQRKLEEKAQKKLARVRELEERQARKLMEEEREKQRKLEEERIAQEEKAKEEAERLEKEKKEREEHELYLQMKQNFSIDEEGYEGDDNEEESQNKLQTFMDYIKNKKVVHMDELAGHFNMKTPEVIQRVQALLEQELLIGVIDDRGKFIYITEEELRSVAKFIKQRGRISLTELAENSNNLIKLLPADAVVN